MGLPSRRSLAEARIALGSFDRFLLLYGTMFAAFGAASPFLPALLHERGLGPSEIGAVLAAGTANLPLKFRRNFPLERCLSLSGLLNLNLHHGPTPRRPRQQTNIRLVKAT